MKGAIQKILLWVLKSIGVILVGLITFTPGDVLKVLEGLGSTVLVSLRGAPPSCAAYLKGYGNTEHLLVLELNKSAHCSVAIPSKEKPTLTTFDKYGNPPSSDNVRTLQNDSEAAVQVIWVGRHNLKDSDSYGVTVFNKNDFYNSSERFKINLDNEITNQKNTYDNGRNKLILKSVWSIEREKATFILSIAILFCLVFLL